jgi:hypothetical protein
MVIRPVRITYGGELSTEDTGYSLSCTGPRAPAFAAPEPGRVPAVARGSEPLLAGIDNG